MRASFCDNYRPWQKRVQKKIKLTHSGSHLKDSQDRFKKHHFSNFNASSGHHPLKYFKEMSEEMFNAIFFFAKNTFKKYTLI